MATKPSLPLYVGIGAFLSVLVVFLTYGQARDTTVSLEFLGFALAFSAVHVTVMYLVSKRWAEYVLSENDGEANAVDGA